MFKEGDREVELGRGYADKNQGSFPVGKVAPARWASRGRKGLDPVQRASLGPNPDPGPHEHPQQQEQQPPGLGLGVRAR